MDLSQLKALDALYFKNDYSDEVFGQLLPHVDGYLQSRERLRALPLREVQGATVMLAGGKR